MVYKYIVCLFLFVLSPAVFANEVTVEYVEVKQNNDKWDFYVRLKHEDSGWDHYADAWRIVDLDGKELARRVLYHPHVNEQPFTRSLRDVAISENDLVVFVEAHDKVHGWSKKRVRIHMQTPEGENYKILTYRQ